MTDESSRYWNGFVQMVRDNYAHRLAKIAWRDMRPLQQRWVQVWVEQFAGTRSDDIRGLR